MIDFDMAVGLVRDLAPKMLAIDGLPVSGKSTLAGRLENELGASIVYLDDFVRPHSEWRGSAQPAFPFPYIRYAEFMDAVLALAGGRKARYRPYDWAHERLSDKVRVVSPASLIVIDGVSALHPDLAKHYALSFWIESDQKTTIEASLARGVGNWETEGRELFMPSVAIYLGSMPRLGADYVVSGRGAGQ